MSQWFETLPPANLWQRWSHLSSYSWMKTIWIKSTYYRFTTPGFAGVVFCVSGIFRYNRRKQVLTPAVVTDVNFTFHWIDVSLASDAPVRRLEHGQLNTTLTWRAWYTLEQCNPWPHVANRHNLHNTAIVIVTSFSLWRHSRVSRLRRSQPSFSLWRHSHRDVIRYWGVHAHHYRRTYVTYGHLTVFNI